MSSIGAGIATLLVIVVLFAPRKWALMGMMAGVLYLTQKQAIDVLGLNVTAIRLLEVAGVIRILVRAEFSFSELNPIDRGLILLYGYTTLVFLVRSDVGQGEIVGSMVDASFCYFIFRGLIRNIEELKWFLCVLAVVLVPFVALLSVEVLAHENPFSLIGAETWPVLRGDSIRAMGSFRNPSSLGTLGASLLPLYIGLALTKNNRIRAFLGVGLSLGIVYLSNSGGPVSAAAVGMLGWLCWVVRRKMFNVRWVLVGVLVLLALLMKAPIWYLIARVSSVTGGAGWHRAYLMNVAFENIDKWWFAGMDIKQTRDWLPYVLGSTGVADITNNFIAFGLRAGVFAIALLILLLIRTFRSLGQALALVRRDVQKPKDVEYLLWALGCVVVSHIVSWLGITYFDQMYVVWFMHLAAISSISHAWITDNESNAVVDRSMSDRIVGGHNKRPRWHRSETTFGADRKFTG